MKSVRTSKEKNRIDAHDILIRESIHFVTK